MTTGQYISAALYLLALLGFVVFGVIAYRGTWLHLRRRMLLDPEGHRVAGSLWLGLAGVSSIAMVSFDTDSQGLKTAMLALIFVHFVPCLALAYNRPARLTRALTPRWLLEERRMLFGELDAAGRPRHPHSTLYRPYPWATSPGGAGRRPTSPRRRLRRR